MHADIVGALRIARLAESHSWLWTVEDAELFCRLAQFQVNQRHPELAALQTTLRVVPPTGALLSSRKLLASAGRPGQSVASFSVNVTDSGDESNPALHESLIDLFANLSDSFIAELGSPTRLSPGEYAEVGWDYDDFAILLTIMDSSVALGIVNPAYLRWWEEDDSMDDGDEEFEREESDNDQFTPANILTWNERRDALLAAVTRLKYGIKLVLRTAGGSAVTFAIVESRLTVRVTVGPNDRSRIGTNDVWFATHGWVEQPSDAQECWERWIAWPTRYHKYMEEVEAATLVLREALRVENSSDITVEVF